MGGIKPELKTAILRLMIMMRQLEMKRPFGKDRISLDVLQYWLLSRIAAMEPSIKDVEKLLNLSRNIVVSNIAYLEKTGLITKDKSSGREARLLVTALGRELMSEVDAQVEAMLNFAEASYSIREERLLVDFMTAFSSSIEGELQEAHMH